MILEFEAVYDKIDRQEKCDGSQIYTRDFGDYILKGERLHARPLSSFKSMIIADGALTFLPSGELVTL